MSAVSIPIIIHLINFRRHKTLYFSNTSFLENIKKETQTRTKIKHLLILIARILTIAMLVFAFAGPFIPNKNITSNTKPAQISAIYIDNSFSMEAEGIKGQIFEQAKQVAKEIIFNSSAGMKYLYITNDMLPENQIITDRDAIIRSIDKTSISSNHININDVILKANTIIPKNERANLFIISDMQKTFLDNSNINVDDNIDPVFIPLTTSKVNNLYIDSCYFETPVHKLGQQEILKIKMVNNSDEDFFDIPVQLYINDTLKVMASFSIESQQSKEIDLEYVNTVNGEIRGRLEISDYPVTYDNFLYFNYKISDHTEILIINSGNDSRYLTALFESDPDNFRLSQVKLGNEQSTVLENYNVIILNNFSEISTGLSSNLQTFVNNGGSVVFIPAAEINHNLCNDFLGLFNVGRFETGKYTNTRIFNIEYNHELFRNVFQRQEKQTDLPVMGLVHKYTLYSSSAYNRILSTENNNPVLISGNYNSGKLYIMTAPLTDINSEFVKSTLFVPAFFNIALNSQINNTMYAILRDGATIDINTQEEINDYDIYHISNGIDMDVYATFRIVGKTLQVQIPKDIKTAGDYKLLNGNNIFIAPISLNYDRKESDLRYYNKEDLNQYIGVNFDGQAKILEANSGSLDLKLKEISEGRQLWQLFLILSLIFILCEVLLARLLK
jgi:hypothetical protein